MTSTTYRDLTTPSPRSARPSAVPRQPGARDVLLLSAWCGLTGGLLEVGTKVLCRSISPTNRLYQVSRHFVWLAPLTYLLLFLVMGLFLAAVTRIWPRRGGWLSRRLIVACALVPALMAAGPQIYNEAWLVLALGMASRVVPLLERHASELRRWLLWSFLGVLGMVLVLAGSIYAGDRVKERREAQRPLPPADSPNVLLIVLDTVRADHLSLYGYHRATTPNLDQLAKRGIRFEHVRATAPWTLPSHASMFTGRWPHELGVEWMTPLRGNFPTLAEYLGSHGYATAGFAANTLFCSYDTGIDRGFTHYEDYEVGPLDAARTALVVDVAFKGVFGLAVNYGRSFDAGPLRPLQVVLLGWILARDRISARAINLKFLDWLNRRREPRRPFFAFLNYFDAHTPYLPPDGIDRHFGLRPEGPADLEILRLWNERPKQNVTQREATLVHDAYDDCIAYLDDQLGRLFDELERRGMLKNTLVIVTSDHGEQLGEHGFFGHGKSLYAQEVRVPLLIIPPGGMSAGMSVRDPVSLRDLAATVADVVNEKTPPPFPGKSLTRYWTPVSSDRQPPEELVLSEASLRMKVSRNSNRPPAWRGPMQSLVAEGKVYIHNADGREELYDLENDPSETHDLAASNDATPILERLRLLLQGARRQGGTRAR